MRVCVCVCVCVCACAPLLVQCGLINWHVDPGSQPLMGYNSREKLSYPVLLHNTHSSAPQAASHIHPTPAV